LLLGLSRKLPAQLLLRLLLVLLGRCCQGWPTSMQLSHTQQDTLQTQLGRQQVRLPVQQGPPLLQLQTPGLPQVQLLLAAAAMRQRMAATRRRRLVT
jgi:hypothetical protein